MLEICQLTHPMLNVSRLTCAGAGLGPPGPPGGGATGATGDDFESLSADTLLSVSRFTCASNVSRLIVPDSLPADTSCSECLADLCFGECLRVCNFVNLFFSILALI